MTIFNKVERLLLFFGDLFVFGLSIWVALFLRNGQISSFAEYKMYALPFLIIFCVWVLVFYIAGLYDKYTAILRDKISALIFNAQLVNSALAIAFFYLIPYFGIAPKTILFIDLVVSFFLIYLWRIYSHPLFKIKDRELAILIGSGEELKELEKEVNENPHSELRIISSVNLDDPKNTNFTEEIIKMMYAEDIKIVIVDLKDGKVAPILPHLYNLIFSGVRFFDMDKVYEDVFNKIPLSLLTHSWFLENISSSPKFTYDVLKRIMDIIISLPLFIISLPLYPCIMLLIRLESSGSPLSHQKRIGENNRIISLLKFRTMLFNDDGDWKTKGKENKVTKVGAFLRTGRLDEIPQLWNVLFGDISLIGPRPEFPEPVKEYTKEIDFYNIRHIIKPGLSGWAQIWQENHPHHNEPDKVMKTKEKLSYDLYYVKNRSLMLDLKIALKTLKILAMRVGK